MEFVHIPLPWSSKPIYIKPIGDIQYTSNEEDICLRILKEEIEDGLDHDAWFLGLGDYTDFMSPSNRSAYRSAKLYDNALNEIDASAKRNVDNLYGKYLFGTAGKWAGMLGGHHTHELQDGTTTDQYLCQKLGCPYLGTQAIITFAFHHKGGSGLYPVRLMAWHGMGSGQTGAMIRKMDNWVRDWDVDVAVMGHMTKMESAKTAKIYPVYKNGVGKLIHRDRLLIGSGGFAKGYKEYNKQGRIPCGDYVEQGGMRPVALGSPLISIQPRRTQTQFMGQRFRYFDPKIKGTI